MKGSFPIRRFFKSFDQNMMSIVGEKILDRRMERLEFDRDFGIVPVQEGLFILVRDFHRIIGPAESADDFPIDAGDLNFIIQAVVE